LKKTRHILFFLFLVLTTGIPGYAQYFTIPDANFKNYLVNSHPTLLNGSQQLIIANAKNFAGTISCSNLNIQSLSGIEYFYKVNMLNCAYNPIMVMPSLDSLTAVTAIWAEGCNLAQFPRVNHLSNLQTLVLKKNELTTVPSLTGLVNLQYFDCSANHLTQIPDLSTCTSLQKFYCWDNNITELPDLSTLVNLQVLDCPANKITVLPSFSSNPLLQIIRCNGNLLTELPSLTNLLNLKELSVNSNKLSLLPDLSANTQLQTVDVAFNNLLKFPDLSAYMNLTSVTINNNQLGFSELIPLTSHPSFNSVFVVTPQDTIFNYPYLQLNRNSIGIIPSGIDANITSDAYQWYKDGNLILNANNSYITLNPPVLGDSGFYLCKVQNSTPALAGMTLVVKAAQVIIGPCISASVFDYSVLSNKCMEAATIEINESAMTSSYKPFKYHLIPVNNQSDVFSDSFVVKNIQPGKYDLKIIDQNNCSIYLQQYINIPVASDCDNIITPNGDGMDDFYFIEKTGKARVYNKEGKPIKEMSIPAEWDGLDNSGKLVPMGYYIILINEKEKVGVIVLN
jgi:hypothetical protein